ncbi:MAG: acyl--CoA ligase [Actinobacteria bacterium]|nr:acyl--CoA ligase [Actinomycetota bacterium]
MAGPGEVDLLAIVAPRRRAADLVRDAWDAGDAVTVIDPAAPAATVARVLATVAPTHLVDLDGRHPLSDGLPAPAGTAAVVVTSGTTGTPKGVELTVEGAIAIGHGWAGTMGHRPTDHWLLTLPLHHVAGLAILARSRVTGADVTIVEGFDLDEVGGAPGRFGATLVSVVPTMLGRLLDAGAPMHEYRGVVTGGAPVPPALRARADALGVPVFDAYGQSETWGGCVANGRPIPGAAVRLGPADEIEISGPMVMRDYRRDPEASRRAFTHDGWLRTGDVGRFAPDGRLEVVDRLRDLIISGGVNVSPVEVEQVLAEHPAVADVAVVGAPDAEWGERVVAHVVPADPTSPPSLDDLRAFTRERLTAAKLPRELVLVREVPRSPGGKILRRELRDPTA